MRVYLPPRQLHLVIRRLNGKKSQRRVRRQTFTVFYFLSTKFFMDFWSKKFVITWDFNVSAIYQFSFWCSAMVFRKILLSLHKFSRFSEVETIFLPKHLKYDQLEYKYIPLEYNPLLIWFFPCFSLWFFIFLLRQYHDSMSTIFILSLKLPFQFFANCALVIIYVMTLLLVI